MVVLIAVASGYIVLGRRRGREPHVDAARLRLTPTGGRPAAATDETEPAAPAVAEPVETPGAHSHPVIESESMREAIPDVVPDPEPDPMTDLETPPEPEPELEPEPEPETRTANRSRNRNPNPNPSPSRSPSPEPEPEPASVTDPDPEPSGCAFGARARRRHIGLVVEGAASRSRRVLPRSRAPSPSGLFLATCGSVPRAGRCRRGAIKCISLPKRSRSSNC